VHVGIIEDYHLALAPSVDVVLDPDTKLLAGLLHDQSEMQP
jgi:hypothetical protein